jgi:hypothetical protein
MITPEVSRSIRCARAGWANVPDGFHPVCDEVILDLFDEWDFISLVIWTVDDESRGFIIDEDVIIS